MSVCQVTGTRGTRGMRWFERVAHLQRGLESSLMGRESKRGKSAVESRNHGPNLSIFSDLSHSARPHSNELDLRIDTLGRSLSTRWESSWAWDSTVEWNRVRPIDSPDPDEARMWGSGLKCLPTTCTPGMLN